MPAYDKATIQGFLQSVDSATTGDARGKAFEELACYLFRNIPGVTITATRKTNTFATEELDIACSNEQDPTGLRNLSAFFLVECKGWKEPVTSEQVAWFLLKIEHRGLDFGVLIAANGITGIDEHLTAAHFLVSFVLALRKIRMVLITRQEIENLASGEEMAQLIIKKVTQLHATGRCY